ncbi:MAG: pirin family protein [Gammaproteobacteria bacterium]|nr:pirin family protein [Gammaproteobacteria bacterium]MDH5177429.1 pirin family protein [Gammaproteobacteria bacterium]MDH5226853.1 pirin family protein [Gammaproteobacteria bacterium]
MTTSRKLQAVIESVAASDGAGVKLRRSLGSRQNLRFDPFLMLDEFFSDNPDDYLAGFPSHPHRGFETVTYMLDGHMRHEDSFGNRGDLGPGDVQWMTAARGIIHSEMPQQTAGRMRGFQLWINLPAREKMKPAAYRDIPSREIPTATLTGGGEIRVIAGAFEQDGRQVAGPISGLSTAPLYYDVRLPAGVEAVIPTPVSHNAFLYVYEGDAVVGDDARSLPYRAAGLLTPGGHVRIRAGAHGASMLLLAGKPIGEPVVQYGPFVMNTPEEIQQAVIDYQRGQLAVPG